MEVIRLRSLIHSLVQDRGVMDFPSLEVVQLPFPVEKEYRILKLLSLALLLSPMVDTRDRPMVDMKRLLDLHTMVDIMHLLDLQCSLTRAATEVPVLLNSLNLTLLQGPITTLKDITLPIKVVGGETHDCNEKFFNKCIV
jgi:hypothetical protein